MINYVFGRLTVIAKSIPYRNKKGIAKDTRWECQCECGNITILRRSHILRNEISSCGCFKKELLKKAKLKRERYRKEVIKRKKLRAKNKKPTHSERYWTDAVYREKILLKCREYMRRNMGKALAKKAKRRAMKVNATPKWLTKEHLEQIKQLYIKAQEMKRQTGEVYHVDHIIPLQGKDVCGLHVPWNLQILKAVDNIRKGNRVA